tara:strand:+ start:375 stop:524 length:150 start_codon:yes stop_codon:yes gene_type:complete
MFFSSVNKLLFKQVESWIYISSIKAYDFFYEIGEGRRNEKTHHWRGGLF